MSVYINGIGAITPQGCYPSDDFLKKPVIDNSGLLKAIEPDYTEFIGPVQLRRMSKIIKMGLTSALLCMKNSGISNPDAIITATGLGCMEDTDRFLNNLTDDDESMLNPTPFIQSTHNAIAARIAIDTGCNEYNMTYVQKNAAFEQAINDALIKLNGSNYSNILVGGTDELTDDNYQLKKHVDLWKPPIRSIDLLEHNNSAGVIPGEGSVFFLLSSDKNEKSIASIQLARSVYSVDNGLDSLTDEILDSTGLSIENIDLVLLGLNGNVEEDPVYHIFTNKIFPNQHLAYYKHLCGEYDTSGSYAMLLASTILKTQRIPDFIKLNNIPASSVNNILIYQHRSDKNHTFTVLSKC